MTQNLANAYRPKSLHEVLGQKKYLQAFKNMLQEVKHFNGQVIRLPQVLLLGGPSGTGKTTLARILAASAMCAKFNKATCEPCGGCIDCESAYTGVYSGPNFMFIDGGGRGLKELVEEDLKRFVYASPFGGARKRVCIADEAQALSAGARNTLLTLTENLPASAMLIYTTTEPEAIDEAVRNRATPVYLSALSRQDIVAGLSKQRPKYAGNEALHEIARLAKGSMRTAWTLLQVAESFNEPLSEKLVASCGGGIAEPERRAMWQHFQDSQYAAVMASFDTWSQAGFNLDTLGQQLLDDAMAYAAKLPFERDWSILIARLSQAVLSHSAESLLWALLASVDSPAKPAGQVNVQTLAKAVAHAMGQQDALDLEDPVTLFEYLVAEH
jgi:DNA polymerase III gamma/tau subunit